MAKKQAINYNPNTALIQGAATAYRNYDNVAGMYAGLEKITETGVALAKQAIDKQSKQIEEANTAVNLFDKAADEVLLKSGALGQTLYDSTYDELVNAKKTYLEGIEEKDDKKRVEGLKYIQNHSAWVQEHKQFNLQLANDIKEGKLSDAHNIDEKGLEETHAMTQIMNGNYTKTSRSKEGDVMFHIKDRGGEEKLVSSTDYKNMSIFKNFEVGNTYIKGKDAILKDETFNGEALGQALLQSMPNNEREFRAVMSDDILGRKGGKQNLKSMLENSTTLDQEILNAVGQDVYSKFDVIPDGVLDPAEKQAFINAVVNVDDVNFNLDTSKQIMVEQLTNAARNDHASHWERKNAEKLKEEQEQQRRYNQRLNQPRDTFNVGYGGGYVTVKSANQLVSDITNKEPTIEVKGRGVFKFNKQKDYYELVTMDGEVQKLTPVSNQYILRSHGSWQEGYGRDIGEYGYLAPGAVKKKNKTSALETGLPIGGNLAKPKNVDENKWKAMSEMEQMAWYLKNE